jgi:hypothetical protein
MLTSRQDGIKGGKVKRSTRGRKRKKSKVYVRGKCVCD